MTMIDNAGFWARTERADSRPSKLKKLLFAARSEDSPNSRERKTIAAIERVFDHRFYLVRNPDVAASGIDPMLHFLRYGEAECRDPSPSFCTRAFHLRYPEVIEAGVNALAYFVDRQQKRQPCIADPVERSDWLALHDFEVEFMAAEFDAAYYKSRNADVGDTDPLYHFAKFGWLEGRDPRPDFSTSAYLARYDDVAAAGINPFFHWLAEGRKEGRVSLNKEAEENFMFEESVIREGFDEAFYLARIAPADLGGDSALRHFAMRGWLDGRNPNRDFSVVGYLSAYDDVRQAGINPYYHWLVEGRREGRLPKPCTDHRSAIVASLKGLDQRASDALAWANGEDIDQTFLLPYFRELLSRPFAVTVSHDNYSAHIGGVQLRVRSEAAAYRAAGLGHLHLFPGHGVLHTIDGGDLVIGILLDGHLLGYACGSTILAALLSAREDEGLAPAGSTCASFTVHSLLGHDPKMLERLARLVGAKSGSFWVHDYASVCAGLHLMRNDVQSCGTPPSDSVACRICVYSPQRDAQHRAHARFFAALPFKALAPSSVAAKIFHTYHPDVPVSVREHLALVPLETKPRAGGSLRIAFLGHAASHKGWHDFLELAETFAGRMRFFHIATGADDVPGVERIEATPDADGTSAFPRLVEETHVDYAFIGSAWSETFCLTAYEAVAGGAKVLTYDVSGNVAELARKGHGTVFMDLAEVKAFIAERVDYQDFPQRRALYAIDDRQLIAPPQVDERPTHSSKVRSALSTTSSLIDQGACSLSALVRTNGPANAQAKDCPLRQARS